MRWDFVLILISSILYSCSNLYVRKWLEERGDFFLQNHSLIFVAFCLYVGGWIFWIASLQFSSFIKSVVYLGLLIGVLGVMFEVVIFKQNIAARSLAAMFFALISIILLQTNH